MKTSKVTEKLVSCAALLLLPLTTLTAEPLNMTGGLSGAGSPQQAAVAWCTSVEAQRAGLPVTAINTALLDEDLPRSRIDGGIRVRYLPESFAHQGYVTIGREIVYYAQRTDERLEGIMRGCFGTPLERHRTGSVILNNVVVWDRGSAGEGSRVFCIDTTPPSIPGGVRSAPAGDGTVRVSWDAAGDDESGVAQYEIQERTLEDPEWVTVSDAAGNTTNAILTHDGAQDGTENGISRVYRIRAKNAAGIWSDWSCASPAVTAPAAADDPRAPPAAAPGEIISSLSSYPNPVDARKGGEEGVAHIVYVLAEDSDLQITVYDLLGYEVTDFSFPAGSEGGRKGWNEVHWDCTNRMNDKVAKGGYIAHITVRTDRGTATAMRKIGVIH
jgi:hypothetical protein